MRLFLAVALPDEVKTALLRPYRRMPGVKWVRPEQMHLTLRFLGETPESQLPLLIDAMSTIVVPVMTMQLTGCGFFPGIFWCSPAPSEPLVQLKKAIDESLFVDLAIPPENRPFVPHITLARIKGPLARAHQEGLISTFGTIPPQTFTATQFQLYSSTLAPEGAIHRCEAVFPTAGHS